MSATIHHLNRNTPSPEEELLNALIAEPSPFDLKTIQMLTDEAGNLSLRVMVRPEGEAEWFLIRTPKLSGQKVIFLADAILHHHGYHYPERQETITRWIAAIHDDNVPYAGVSLIMGIN